MKAEQVRKRWVDTRELPHDRKDFAEGSAATAVLLGDRQRKQAAFPKRIPLGFGCPARAIARDCRFFEARAKPRRGGQGTLGISGLHGHRARHIAYGVPVRLGATSVVLLVASLLLRRQQLRSSC